MLTADGRMGKFAIEDLLLLRRQQRAYRIVRLIDDLVVLAMEVVVQLLHFSVRITHQSLDLMELVRRQLERAIEALNKIVRSRHLQQTISVCSRSESESEQEPSDSGYRSAAPF